MEMPTLEQVHDFRARVNAHAELSDEEIASMIRWLRQERIAAKPVRAKKEKADKPAPVSLAELDDL